MCSEPIIMCSEVISRSFELIRKKNCEQNVLPARSGNFVQTQNPTVSIFIPILRFDRRTNYDSSSDTGTWLQWFASNFEESIPKILSLYIWLQTSKKHHRTKIRLNRRPNQSPQRRNYRRWMLPPTVCSLDVCLGVVWNYAFLFIPICNWLSPPLGVDKW